MGHDLMKPTEPHHPGLHNRHFPLQLLNTASCFPFPESSDAHFWRVRKPQSQFNWPCAPPPGQQRCLPFTASQHEGGGDTKTTGLRTQGQAHVLEEDIFFISSSALQVSCRKYRGHDGANMVL